MVLSLVEGEAPPNARCQRIGPALLFERLWHAVGCRAVLEELAAGRQVEFAAERAVFLTVLHRLFVSGSDRAAEKWRADYRIEGTEALQLHHLYPRRAARRSSRSQRADAALPQGPRGRGAVCPSARPVRRTQRRLHGHHQPVLRGTGRRGAWSSRPFERRPPGSPSDDRRAGHGSGRAGHCAASCGPATPPMSPPCCRSSTGCALVLASAASASSPTAA